MSGTIVKAAQKMWQEHNFPAEQKPGMPAIMFLKEVMCMIFILVLMNIG